MRIIDAEKSHKATELEQEYIRLMKEWEKAKDQATSLEEFDKTKPLFDKALDAANKCMEFEWEHASSIFASQIDDEPD